MLPTTTAYVTIGAYGWQPGAWPLWVALATLVVFSVGGFAVDRCRRRRGAAGSDHCTAVDGPYHR